jgi:sigma-B regulation protein RsbU (phosphoserine phosphatase)
MPVLMEKRRLLWLGWPGTSEGLAAVLARRWQLSFCHSVDSLARDLAGAGVVLIAPSAEEDSDPFRISTLLDAVDRSGAVAVVLLPVLQGGRHLLDHRRGQFIALDADAGPEVVLSVLESAAALQPVIRDLRNDVAALRGCGSGMPMNFQQLDEEMRLAARLQRDFLPQRLPAVGPVRFASLFRPASWLSGDIFDVFRLDESHVGFYVADVVGHGMPAALLTMFIKKALQTKRITGEGYEILPPEQALALLNTDICQQNLSSCQFCTAVYGIVDTASLTLMYARGGHPPPILLTPGRDIRRLDAPGSLLGVFPDEVCQGGQVQLRAGDRLVMFTDGADDVLAADGREHDGPLTRSVQGGLAEELLRLRGLSPDDLMLQLTARIEQARPESDRDDDVTVLAMDIEPCRDMLAAA